MRFSLNFLEEFITVKIKPQELAKKLTLAGIEIVSLERQGSDWVFEAEVTANRPDLLSVFGLSFEAAALLGQKVKFNSFPLPPQKSNLPIYIEDKKSAPFYLGRLIEGVKVKPSPAWLVRRLLAVGLEPVNNVVDITNYCLFKWGAPLHAFDWQKVEEKLLVRRAKAGEKLMCLDEKERELDSADIIIADRHKPLAIAGIIGGKNSEINPKTKSVFLEAAVFDALAIRRTRRRLGIMSEAAYRFERRVFPFCVQQASFEAANLICELAGGRLVSACRRQSAKEKKPKSIIFSLSRFNNYLDTNLNSTQVKAILSRLGCKVTQPNKNTLKVLPPLLRYDLTAEVDLFEEVGRIYGYDKIPPRLSRINNNAKTSLAVDFKNKLKTLSAQAGFKEIISFSLISQEQASKLGLAKESYARLINPLRSGENVLRPTLLSGLLAAFNYNLSQSQTELDFFEIADVYQRNQKEVQEEAHYIVGCLGEKEEEFLSFKARVLFILHSLGIEEISFTPAKNYKYFSAAAFVKSKDAVLGVCGLGGKMLQKKGSKWKVFVFEAGLKSLLAAAQERKYKPLPAYPGVKRDVSLALADTVDFSQLVPVISQAGGEILENIETVDFYRGPNLPQGYYGITLRFYYRLPQRTLRAEEVDAAHAKVREALAASFGVRLR